MPLLRFTVCFVIILLAVLLVVHETTAQEITIKGRIVDTDGKPIAGAGVYGQNGDFYGTAETDAKGEYVLNATTRSRNSGSRDAYVGVRKAGMMTALQKFPLNPEQPPVIDFTLKPAGKPLNIMVAHDEPIQGFYITLREMGEQMNVSSYLLTDDGSRPRTDENGRWTWHEAPDEEVMLDMFAARGEYMSMRNKKVVASDRTYVFRTTKRLIISGSVTDAETAEAVQKFDVYFGRTQSDGRVHWKLEPNAGTEETYNVSTEEEGVAGPCAVKIEAVGYAPSISRDIRYNEESITVNFALLKLLPGQAGIYGIVLQPGGMPAEDAAIAMATHNRNRSDIQFGRIDRGDRYTVTADAAGKFQFMYIDFEEEAEKRVPTGVPRADYILFLLHDTGFKRITQQDWDALNEPKIITLEPWGSIEGTVKVGTQPGSNLPVQCSMSFSNERSGSVREPLVRISYQVTADASGKFSFDKVPPSTVRVQRAIRYHDDGTGFFSTGSHGTGGIELQPGETARVALGGVGRPVMGKLVPSAEFEMVPNWIYSHIVCMPMLEEAVYPHLAVLQLRETMVPEEFLEGSDRTQLVAWLETEEGKKYNAAVDELTKEYRDAQERNRAKQALQRVCAVAKDGTFRLDDIFEGDWQFTVDLQAPPPPGQSVGMNNKIGTLERKFFVTAVPGGVSDEPLNLGTLEVKWMIPRRPMPQAGEEAPDFAIIKIDPIAEEGTFENKGEKLRLSDYKGKYVILDFWAMWCGPCLAKLPELKALYETIKDDERFVLIGISLDGAGSEEQLGKFILNRGMSWLHGLAGNWEGDAVRSYGVRAIPALFLIDTEGDVLLTNPSLEGLTKSIEELRR